VTMVKIAAVSILLGLTLSACKESEESTLSSCQNEAAAQIERLQKHYCERDQSTCLWVSTLKAPRLTAVCMWEHGYRSEETLARALGCKPHACENY
jgi:hypothetical protein